MSGITQGKGNSLPAAKLGDEGPRLSGPSQLLQSVGRARVHVSGGAEESRNAQPALSRRWPAPADRHGPGGSGSSPMGKLIQLRIVSSLPLAPGFGAIQHATADPNPARMIEQCLEVASPKPPLSPLRWMIRRRRRADHGVGKDPVAGCRPFSRR